MTFRLSHFLAILLIISGCTVGPDYKRPEPPLQKPTSFVNGPDENGKVQLTISQWWERIEDPHLQKQVDELLSSNLDLKQGTARILQAKAARRSAAGAFWPSLSTEKTARRNFSPGSNFGGGGFGVSEDRIFTTNYDALASTSWELDFFGRVRRSVQAGDARLQASIFDQNALVHSLIAELVNFRVAISTNIALKNLAKDIARARERTFDTVSRRYNLGIEGVSQADVFQAKENYLTVRSDIAEFERLTKENIYLLDVLLGKQPGHSGYGEEKFAIISPPIDVPIGIPASLIDRRPDLRASELRLAASTADIGVAVADLYPQLTLSGSLGFTNDNTNDLFTADQLTGSLLGSIMTRIFQGGSLRANIQLQKAEAEELAAVYAENILNAVREVETALSNERELGRELKDIRLAVQSIRRAEKSTKERYNRGIVDLLDVLDIQQRRYSAEQNLIRAQQAKWNARVALYLALGGDWLKLERSGLYSLLDRKL